MKLKYLQTFNVTGHGEFPFDMLRYDRCWPSSELRDSKNLATPVDLGEFLKERTVTLHRYTEGNGKNFNDNPTARRWESFGWTVSNVCWNKLA